MQNKDAHTEITDKAYWDAFHERQGGHIERDFSNYKNLIDRDIFQLIQQYASSGTLLEIGAGSSGWLIDIAKQIELIECTGLDYSQTGCDVLKKKSQDAGVSLIVMHADMFDPPTQCIKKFDCAVSFGVVEHFEDLALVMKAKSKFVKPDGVLITVIPNMAGIYGWLTKKLNKAVYDIHNPHDLSSFIDGHIKAGLNIVLANYLGSVNFGVISSCFKETKGVWYWLYKQLTRVSKIIWFFESRFCRLPATRLLSPYILIVSKVSK